MTVYIIVFKDIYSGAKRIADTMYFSTYEKAWEWKRDQIHIGNCGNPIDMYDVISLRQYTQAPQEIHEQFD